MLSGLVEQTYVTFLRLKQKELECEVNLGYTGDPVKKQTKKKKQSNNNNKTNKGHINSKNKWCKEKKHKNVTSTHYVK